MYVYHFDGTGHTVAITNSARVPVNKYAYSAYGEILGQQEGIAQPFKYAGQVGVFAETGNIYYMRARYYDAGTGRFISEDPAGFIDGPNLYAYVGGNPVGVVDPSGQFRENLMADLGKGLGIIFFSSAPKIDSDVERRLVENYFIGNGGPFYLTQEETARYRQNPQSVEFDFGIGNVANPQASGLLDTYDFNSGNRPLYPEVATRVAGAVGPPLGGKDFNVYTSPGCP